MSRWLAALAVVVGLLAAGMAAAHEVRPAYLEIDQTGPGYYTVTWKQPTLGDLALHLVPHLSSGWLEAQPADQYAADGFRVTTWKIHARRAVGIDDQTVTIEGLPDTVTDVLVRVRQLNGQRLDRIVRPEAPSFQIAFADGNSMGVAAFVWLGITHILTGPDHLLFLLGLLLIVKDRWVLLKTVTAFTVAHSLTLAAATFGLITLSTSLLNTLIALSILFIAPEALRARTGGVSLTIRYPWVIAFAFGLLHGMGFASGLTSLGLDRGSLAGALVSFNIGVEIGQLAFIGLILALMRAFRLMEIRWPRPLQLAPTYAIGVAGAGWTFQYGAALFGLAG
jgi:hypothetical protein